MELRNTAFDSALHSLKSDKGKWADDWFQKLIWPVRAAVEEIRGDTTVRVAILDTGVDGTNSQIRKALETGIIVEGKGFPESRDPFRDLHGHGTHGASVLMKTAPFIALYVARVTGDRGHLEEEELGNEYIHIANAIDWAVEKKVHIISMSWGMKRDIPSIAKSVTNAIHHGVLVFASASNVGANFRITFPARLPRVFCIGSADGLGAQSNFSPPFPGEEKYSTLGEGVSAAAAKSESHLPGYDAEKEEIRKDGTSVAAPIAAGIAALLICYTRQFLPKGRGADTYENMRKLFLAMSEATAGKDYRYLAVWDLFERDDPQTHIKKILIAPADVDKHWTRMSLLDATMLFNIGNTCNDNAKYSQAIACYQRALEIYERDPQLDPIYIADTLDRLGQACYFQGHYIESLSSHKRALEIVGENHYKAAQILPRIAGVYIAQGNYDQAIVTSLKALEVCEAFSFHSSSFRAYSLRNIGEAYLLTRRSEDAWPRLQAALNIYLVNDGEWSQWTARAIILIGKYHHYRDDMARAEMEFDRAIRIMSHLFGKMHLGSVVALEAYSEFLIDTQRARQAIEMLQRVIVLYRDAVGEVNLRATRALHLLGRAHVKNGDYTLSISHYLQALEIIELHYGPKYNAEAGLIMKELAVSYRATNQEEKAVGILRVAVALLEIYFGEDHVFTLEIKKESNVAAREEVDGHSVSDRL